MTIKKTSDIIAEELIRQGVSECFTLVGGGAMHLNDSFGYAKGLKCRYFQHEQGAALAAESYARVDGTMPVVCVTTGPGGTNALTGVLCAWQDSVPMLVISGQVKRSSMISSTGLSIRQFGDQEYNIIDSVVPMTKYAVTVMEPERVKYYVQKAVHIANTGRRGPCWLDIPLDVQGAFIDDCSLEEYEPEAANYAFDGSRVLEELKRAKRPAILAGSAIRTSEMRDEFVRLVQMLGMPVVAAKSIADILPVGFDYYFGNFGTNGGRAGNYIVQNADCLLALGCRLSFGQVGFNYTKFSPNSTKIVVDADAEELRKALTKIDVPVHADLAEFLPWLIEQDIETAIDPVWFNYCNNLKESFPIYQDKFSESVNVNPYYFARALQKHMDPEGICVVGNSCSSVSIKQCGVVGMRQRMWGNVNCGTMGYDIPAAIGASLASKKQVICCTGDGSFQLNIQELQTVKNYGLPIKFFVFNNGGYKSIIASQSKNFGRLSGCTQESGLDLPEIEGIARGYGIPYCCFNDNGDVEENLESVLNRPGYLICEVIEDANSTIEPKLGSKILDSGEIVSPELTDLLPEIDEELSAKFATFVGYKESTSDYEN